jgi:cytochrome c biogenesis protein CcmG/thiol:disulfide interchange protein DsbE
VVEAVARRARLGLALRALAVAAVTLFVALLTYGLLAKAPDTTINDALARGEAVPAPGFDLAVLRDGTPGPLAAAWNGVARDGRVGLEELRGTPVVLNFWASWCIPCREEAPLLERRWREAGRQGVLFVGLNMQDVGGDALGFLRQFGQTFPTVRDPSNATARRWGVTGIPETFFISARGQVVGHVIGLVSAAQLDEGIAAARAGRVLSPQQGGARRPTS